MHGSYTTAWVLDEKVHREVFEYRGRFLGTEYVAHRRYTSRDDLGASDGTFPWLELAGKTYSWWVETTETVAFDAALDMQAWLNEVAPREATVRCQLNGGTRLVFAV